MLKITPKNILNWLKLILEIYPLDEDEKFAIRRFINRRNHKLLFKEIEDIFDEWEE